MTQTWLLNDDDFQLNIDDEIVDDLDYIPESAIDSEATVDTEDIRMGSLHEDETRDENKMDQEGDSQIKEETDTGGKMFLVEETEDEGSIATDTEMDGDDEEDDDDDDAMTMMMLKMMMMMMR